jgi:hypothetical protein
MQRSKPFLKAEGPLKPSFAEPSLIAPARMWRLYPTSSHHEVGT